MKNLIITVCVLLIILLRGFAHCGAWRTGQVAAKQRYREAAPLDERAEEQPAAHLPPRLHAPFPASLRGADPAAGSRLECSRPRVCPMSTCVTIWPYVLFIDQYHYMNEWRRERNLGTECAQHDLQRTVACNQCQPDAAVYCRVLRIPTVMTTSMIR